MWVAGGDTLRVPRRHAWVPSARRSEAVDQAPRPSVSPSGSGLIAAGRDGLHLFRNRSNGLLKKPIGRLTASGSVTTQPLLAVAAPSQPTQPLLSVAAPPHNRSLQSRLRHNTTAPFSRGSVTTQPLLAVAAPSQHNRSFQSRLRHNTTAPCSRGWVTHGSETRARRRHECRRGRQECLRHDSKTGFWRIKANCQLSFLE